MKLDEYEIPPCDTRGHFFDDSDRIDSAPCRLANENSQVDDDAVFSTLQFGAIIPPLSPWKGIHRLLPGFRYQGTKMVCPVDVVKGKNISMLNAEQQADEIDHFLDTILKRHIGEQRDPVLLFSGGVDSGIIASRLAALGYRDSLLLNFSFGDDDPESKLAEAMANHLGLKFERVSGSRRPCTCLNDPGAIYPQPFGDHSTVPTSDLAHSVVERLSNQERLILDGTGADGAFGMTAKIDLWERMSRIPQIVKTSAAFAYGKMIWHRRGRIEYLARILRRSAEMPLLSAVLAQNPLAGTFYKKDNRHSVDDLLERWIGGWAGDKFATRVVAADLAMTCANTFAQKAQPILESGGHKILYPFFEVEAVSTSLSSISYWQMDEPKAPLKKSLARCVPHNMVYRTKSGFVDPSGKVFFDKEFIEHLRSTSEPTGPIAHMLEKKPILKSCELLARNKSLPAQTLNLIWAVVFMDRWYRTAFQQE
ncbi:MAG: asparagine synthase [Thiohalocapsa sp. PB-PSB1]|jgi:asparagine synthase (glutamine-hydrolysing)|nr:MAG: asparagine synthase [Thiohalocapsa sp. PB-PSB1]